MRTWGVLAWMLLAAAAVRGAAEPPPGSEPRTFTANPLPNPGFEEGDGHWAIDEEVSRIVAEAAHSGRLGLRVGADHYNPAGSSVTSARLPVAPDQEISLTFWARSKSSAGGVYLFYYNAAGKTVGDPKLHGGFPTCPVNQADDNWHQYTLRARVPAGAASVAVWVHAYAGATGMTDLDDLVLTGIAPGAAATDTVRRRRPRPAAAPVTPADLAARKEAPIIVLKLDDVKQFRGNVHPSWQRLADYLASRHIKASFGVICETLADATPEYTRWLKERHASGLIEFWCHGWDHATHEVAGTQYNEFSHRPYEEQKKRFDDSQRLAQVKLGFPFHAFGPPGGVGTAGYDADTFRVMADDPHMKVWLYPQPLDAAGKALADAGKVVILDRVWDVNLEGAVGVPDYERFVQGYARHPDRRYFVLQGHPAMWSPERFAEFTRILDFLVAQKAVFLTPSECAARE